MIICLSTKAIDICSPYLIGIFHLVADQSEPLRPISLATFFHCQVMGRGQMGEMENPSYGRCSSLFFIEFTSAYSKLVFRLCLGSKQLDLLNECCAFGAFRFFSVSILAPVLDQAKADLIVIASSGVRLLTRNKRGTSVPLFLPINLRSSKITRTIERILSL